MESVVRARIDSEIKTLAEINMQKMGLTPSTVIRLLYIAIAEQGKLPFEVRIPNEETLQAFRDIKEGRTFKAKSIDDLMEQLNAAGN